MGTGEITNQKRLAVEAKRYMENNVCDPKFFANKHVRVPEILRTNAHSMIKEPEMYAEGQF